ncbi:MAG: hypothetical protein QG620_445 [Patescibacteria group bacterium]|nr:hypothetical protein [Patescibacteria group bacterium]
MKNNVAKIKSLLHGVIPKKLVNSYIDLARLTCSLFFDQVVQNEKIKNFSHEDGHVFFGYYDVTPFGMDDKLLLAMKTPIIGRAPNAEDHAEIGYYHIDKPDNFISLGETNTWCWQQGCRLQWYPQDNGDKIIYNCLVDGEYGAVIKDISNGNIVKKIKKPLYSVSRDGKWGVSLDFSRLQRLRPGYGYGILPDDSVSDLAPNYNGIELVDLETNESQQLFTLKDISDIEPHESMDGAEHYFNHIMFNPSGDNFLFFHLWMSKDSKRHSRLFVASRDGKNLRLLSNSGSVSHYNWIFDDKIILYSLVSDKGRYMYAVFDSLSGNVEYFGKNVPKNDGHPTLLKNKKIFITDTYPNLCSQRNLLSYNLDKDEMKILARFDDSRDFTGEFRCDLHPRVSPDEKMICIDRLIDSKRVISIISFDANGL